MRRRDFITLLGAATAVAWPLAARAQADRLRRIGVLMNVGESSPIGQARVAALVQALHKLGWGDGRNVRIDIRWAAADLKRFRSYASELVELAPDVIVANTTPAVTALQQATPTVPIVFANAVDPVGSGLVASLAHPRGNTTGFVSFEYALAAKWLELLKEIAPRVTRAAVLRETTSAAGIGQFAAIQTVGSVGMELSAVDMGDLAELERAVAEFARGPYGGLIVTASQFAVDRPDVLATLTAKYKLPAVYPYRFFVSAGGLMSYGPDTLDPFRLAAGYVDRILKGEKPADLPVQAPTKYELVLNLSAAKALGLDVPATLLARADEIIE
jgi:putative tryptophan/tyrosine transport system substrate-binding protein